MFDSHLNWNNANMLATPWVFPAANNPPENTCHMVLQVQTQSSGFAGNPEGALLSTNRIEWFSTGNPTTALLDTENYKTTPDNAVVAYNSNNPFIATANNTLIAVPSAPAQPNIPSLFTLSVPGLDTRSFILQAAGLMDPLVPRPINHEQSSCVARIIRNVPDAYTVVQGQAPVANVMPAVTPNFGQCVRLPLIGGPAVPPLQPVGTTSQATWVMVVPPNKGAAVVGNESKIETESYITEASPTDVCSSCGITILNQSSQLTQEKKCSNCMEASTLPLHCLATDSEIANDVAIKESPCDCQIEGEKSFGWDNVPCEKCRHISTLEIPETYESDANCQAISTTTAEAGIQASEIGPCLESTFDSEHEEFEPTSQAINSILRKLLEEEIHNSKDTKNLDMFSTAIQESSVENVSFIDLNNSIDEECDTPTTGVKDVLMTESPSACTKRRYGGPQNSAKRVRTASYSTQRRIATCSNCGSKFSSTLNLRKHYMGHENEKSYECAKCKQTVTGCYSYKRHSWSHEKNTDCGDPTEAGVPSESSEEEGIQPYGCAQCGKEFSDSFLLAEHCATHLRGKPFSCTQCEMCFESVVMLEKHSRLHLRTKTVLFNGYEAESESSESEE